MSLDALPCTTLIESAKKIIVLKQVELSTWEVDHGVAVSQVVRNKAGSVHVNGNGAILIGCIRIQVAPRSGAEYAIWIQSVVFLKCN